VRYNRRTDTVSYSARDVVNCPFVASHTKTAHRCLLTEPFFTFE